MKRALFMLAFIFLTSFSLSHTCAAALPSELTAVSQNTEVWQLSDESRYTKRGFQSGDTLEITCKEDILSLYLVFDPPAPSAIAYLAGGQTGSTHGYLHDYIELSEPAKKVTLRFSQPAVLCDVYAFSKDEPLPDFVQRWQPNDAVCDVLFLPTHADDEHLYFGGLLPISAVREGCEVQVAYMVNHNGEYYRPHELLNGLWAVGIRRYPIIPDFPDIYCGSLEYAKTVYDEQEILEYQVKLINSLRPNIIVGHDLNGEYGHGAHMLNASVLTKSVQTAAETQNGWDTPKTYLHLYSENTITADYSEPVAALGNKTALELAKEGFACHKSQQSFFTVEDFGPYDCRKFGLYRTTVGQDTENDIFQNITTHEQQRQLEAQEAERQKWLEEQAASESERRQQTSAAAHSEKSLFEPQAENDFMFAVIGLEDRKGVLIAAALACLLAAALTLCIFWLKGRKR